MRNSVGTGPDRSVDPADMPKAYVRYALTLIFLVAVFNICDRTVLSILVPEIRRDLGLSDRDLGILMGPAFAIVHIVAGLPLARLADRHSRRVIISIGLMAWSLLTVAQGLAHNFVQLLVARMGVGIGEAAGSPPSHSLLADYAPPDRRARILSILQLGALVGGGMGYVLGGWINEGWGWRVAFISVGLPGVVLAVLVFLTLREPRRGGSDAPEVTPERKESALAAALHLFKTPAYAWMLLGVSTAGIVALGRNAWEPTFLREVYQMGSAHAGWVYFLISTVPSMMGTFGGAWVVDLLARRDTRWYFWLPGFCNLLAVPLALGFLLWPETHQLGPIPVAFLFGIVTSILVTGAMPAIFTMGQGLAPPRMRSYSAALWTMIFTFIGMGGGPLLVGDLVERFRPEYGLDATRYALAIASLTPLVAAVAFSMAARSVESDLQKAREA